MNEVKSLIIELRREKKKISEVEFIQGHLRAEILKWVGKPLCPSSRCSAGTEGYILSSSHIDLRCFLEWFTPQTRDVSDYFENESWRPVTFSSRTLLFKIGLFIRRFFWLILTTLHFYFWLFLRNQHDLGKLLFTASQDKSDSLFHHFRWL